jgi:hypothetical protein
VLGFPSYDLRSTGRWPHRNDAGLDPQFVMCGTGNRLYKPFVTARPVVFICDENAGYAPAFL